MFGDIMRFYIILIVLVFALPVAAEEFLLKPVLTKHGVTAEAWTLKGFKMESQRLKSNGKPKTYRAEGGLALYLNEQAMVDDLKLLDNCTWVIHEIEKRAVTGDLDAQAHALYVALSTFVPSPDNDQVNINVLQCGTGPLTFDDAVITPVTAE